MKTNGRLLLLWTAMILIARLATGQQANEIPAVRSTAKPAYEQSTDPLFLEMRQMSLGALQAVPLELAATPTLRTALDELADLHGFIPRSFEAVVLPDQQGSGAAGVWLVELKPVTVSDFRLFLYYIPGEDALYFLRVETGGDLAGSARIWGLGRSELVISQAGIAIVDGPTEKTFRLRAPARSAQEGILDTIACLGRQLGLTPNSTNLGNLLAQSVCGATNIIALTLTAYNCLSFPHPLATIGCIVGVGKLVSCSFANCNSPTGSATVEWTLTDGCADSRGISVRFFDRTRGGYSPSGSSYSIPSGGTKKLTFSAQRGSQLCIGAQTDPATSSSWCVGFNGDQSPSSSLCCATVPSSGKLVKSLRLTCG